VFAFRCSELKLLHVQKWVELREANRCFHDKNRKSSLINRERVTQVTLSHVTSVFRRHMLLRYQVLLGIEPIFESEYELILASRERNQYSDSWTKRSRYPAADPGSLQDASHWCSSVWAALNCQKSGDFCGYQVFTHERAFERTRVQHDAKNWYMHVMARSKIVTYRCGKIKLRTVRYGLFSTVQSTTAQ